MGPLYANSEDNRSSDAYVQFAKDVLSLTLASVRKHVFWNVNYNTKSRFEYIAQIVDFLPLLIEQVCWKKDAVIPYQQGLRRLWEPIYIFKASSKVGNVGDAKVCQDNFIEIRCVGAQKVANHRACFPVGLPKWALELDTKPGDSVFEPFSGSGTTIIAAEMTGRHCYAIELNPAYVDVAVKRWEQFSGSKATLDGDGRTFEQIDEARYAKTGAPDNSAASYDAAIGELRKAHEANHAT
jgi:DNA modification methylase